MGNCMFKVTECLIKALINWVTECLIIGRPPLKSWRMSWRRSTPTRKHWRRTSWSWRSWSTSSVEHSSSLTRFAQLSLSDILPPHTHPKAWQTSDVLIDSTKHTSLSHVWSDGGSQPAGRVISPDGRQWGGPWGPTQTGVKHDEYSLIHIILMLWGMLKKKPLWFQFNIFNMQTPLTWIPCV